jgi:hypothetical protein
MAEGEHTIISKIPRERLNQIAAKKLSALGIAVRLGAGRETLEGELAFAGRAANPLNGQIVPRARFAVEGHDCLRFLDPPLAALGPVPFYDVERTGALEARIAGRLQERGAALQDLAARLRALRLEPYLDPDRLVARAIVKTVQHAFELVGGPDGFAVARVAPVGGRPFDVAPGTAPVRLEDHPSPVDLELWLSSQAPLLEVAAKARAPRGGPPAAPLEPAPPPRNALTLGALVAAFGEDAIVAPTAPVELLREFASGGTHYRFVATREVGTAFRGRVIGPAGDAWADRFELASFPGIDRVTAAALGIREADAPAEEPAPGRDTSELGVPGHLVPHAGEVWVMNVVVEAAGPGEVRYVGTDIDGRPYGAARVLKRSAFEAVFARAGNGFRLLIVVEQVTAEGVVYRQLDAQRQPIGAPRKLASSVLVANFVPEAAAF